MPAFVALHEHYGTLTARCTRLQSELERQTASANIALQAANHELEVKERRIIELEGQVAQATHARDACRPPRAGSLVGRGQAEGDFWRGVVAFPLVTPSPSQPVLPPPTTPSPDSLPLASPPPPSTLVASPPELPADSPLPVPFPVAPPPMPVPVTVQPASPPGSPPQHPPSSHPQPFFPPPIPTQPELNLTPSTAMPPGLSRSWSDSVPILGPLRSTLPAPLQLTFPSPLPTSPSSEPHSPTPVSPKDLGPSPPYRYRISEAPLGAMPPRRLFNTDDGAMSAAPPPVSSSVYAAYSGFPAASTIPFWGSHNVAAAATTRWADWPR